MRHEDRQRLVYRVVELHKRGQSQRAIARALHIDPKTVRRMLGEVAEWRKNGDDAVARALPKPRAPRPSKLDPFLEQINDLLREFPDIKSQRVFEELGKSGFKGSYTIVNEHVRKVRPAPKRRAYEPVKTPPGQQGQADWSPYTLPGCGLKVVAFSHVLHHSSWQSVDLALSRDHASLFRQLVAAFEDIKGVPTEVVFDSEKTVVDRWDNNEPIINLKMAAFAVYYGFSVHIAPRASGEYKGAVERPFRTLEENFLNGRRFRDFEHARAELRTWRDTFALRLHSRKKRRRVDMLEAEQPFLQPLPARPYDTSEIGWRIADGYHRVGFDTNTYSVPEEYVGYRLCVRATETTVSIYDNAIRHIATHPRAPRGANEDQALPEHRRKPRINIDNVMARFVGLSDLSGTFAKRLRDTQRYAGLELSKILQLQTSYRLEDLIAAIEHAHRHHSFSSKAVERILEVHATPVTFTDLFTRQLRESIADTMSRKPVRQRSLADYQKILTSHASEGDDMEQLDGQHGDHPR